MPDLLKISAVFLLSCFSSKKVNIGLVMLAASVALFLLYRMALPSILKTCEHAVLNEVTIKLILALSFIRMLKQILREHDVLSR